MDCCVEQDYKGNFLARRGLVSRDDHLFQHPNNRETGYSNVLGHSRTRKSQVQPGTARYIQVQPGTVRYSAEKTHHVLYFQKSGASRISNMSALE